MRCAFLVAIVLAIVGTAFDVHGQDAKGDLKKIQGEWIVVAMEKGGKKASKEHIQDLRISFKSDVMTFSSTKKNDTRKPPEFLVRLDPSKKPAAFDVVALQGLLQGMTGFGIYQIKGDEFTFVMPDQVGEDPPKGFTQDTMGDCTMYTLKRMTK